MMSSYVGEIDTDRVPAEPQAGEHANQLAATSPLGSEREVQADLSVIVVTHNRAELALRTLRSACSAICDLKVQWIIVDSGSSDDTPERIESVFPEMLVRREQNIGFAAANNRGLELANGRYILLLNPDVETVTGTFDELVKTMDAREEIGVASVIQQTPNGHFELTIRRFPSPWLALGEALAAARWSPLRSWREEEARTARYGEETSADWLVGAFLIARAQAARDVGPLDERFFLYSEETDWCYRFREAGWQVSHLPVMTVVHHTSRRPNADLGAQLSYAKMLFARKHYGRIRAVSIRAVLALRHALRAAAMTVLAPARPRLAAQAVAERHALAVVLGLTSPPFERPLI